MLKRLEGIFTLLLATLSFAQAVKWTSDAAVLFNEATSLFTDNDQIANYVIKQLELDWTVVDGKNFEFMVFVDEESANSYPHYLMDTLNEDENFHYMVDNKKVMKALRFPIASEESKDGENTVKCVKEVNKELLGQILDLSAKTALLTDPESMKIATIATNQLTFQAFGFVVSPESVKQGFSKTVGIDESCYYKYEYQTKWVIHYYGQGVDEPSTENNTLIATNVALNSLMTDMLADPPITSNPALAFNIQDRLERQFRHNYWVVMVNDAGSSNSINYNIGVEDEDFWDEHIEVENFAGKNVVAIGMEPAADDSDACIGGYMPENYFNSLTATTIAKSGSKPENVTDALINIGCETFNLQPLLAVAVKDAKAGLEYILDQDCSFYYHVNDWWVLLYAHVMERK